MCYRCVLGYVSQLVHLSMATVCLYTFLLCQCVFLQIKSYLDVVQFVHFSIVSKCVSPNLVLPGCCTVCTLFYCVNVCFSKSSPTLLLYGLYSFLLSQCVFLQIKSYLAVVRFIQFSIESMCVSSN